MQDAGVLDLVGAGVAEEGEHAVGGQESLQVEAVHLGQVDLEEERQVAVGVVAVTRPGRVVGQVRQPAELRRADRGRGRAGCQVELDGRTEQVEQELRGAALQRRRPHGRDDVVGHVLPRDQPGLGEWSQRPAAYGWRRCRGRQGPDVAVVDVGDALLGEDPHRAAGRAGQALDVVAGQRGVVRAVVGQRAVADPAQAAVGRAGPE
jgi:hypothetical protein